MKRILVTGAAGELGQDLAPWLASRYDVRLTDLREMDTPHEFVQADLCDPQAVAELVCDIDAIVHLAVLLPYERPIDRFVDANVKATCNLLEAAVAQHVRRFVYTSTVWATGHGVEEGVLPVDEDAPWRPVEPYGLTKLQGELAVEYHHRLFGLEAISLRMCGYNRIEGFDEDGNVTPDTLDMPAVAERLISCGVKLFDPGHLGRAYQAAIEASLDGYTNVIVGAAAPLTEAHAGAMAATPLPEWEGLYPGATEMLRSLGVEAPLLDFYYSTQRAEQLLGWRLEYDLAWLVERWSQ
jgi:nucleoside-diphosphate-sugar epimerase